MQTFQGTLESRLMLLINSVFKNLPLQNYFQWQFYDMICIEMKQENLYQIAGINIGNMFNV